MEMSVVRRGFSAPSQRGESVGILAGRRRPGLGSTVRMAGMGSLAWIVSVSFLMGYTAIAAEKPSKAPGDRPAQAKDANETDPSWWTKWDAPVKDPNDPNEMLSVKWGAIVKVLENRDLDQKLKEKIIDRVVSPTFDFPLMGQLALGRTNWPKLNAAQRDKFIELFTSRLKALYLEKTSLYKNQKMVLKPGERKKNQVQIAMTLVTEDGEIALLYKLRELENPPASKSDGRWRIYDVEINGVSILLTYRSQFDDILRRGTVQDLISQLEKSPSQ
jgi:phospholipid transport system substrate-binding protein